MSAALIDPRPPPPKYATKPRTRPLGSCEGCGKAFVIMSPRNANRFCSYVCVNRGRKQHPADFVILVRQRWDAGQSTRAIALWASEHLGRTITPNVIIGIAHRNDFTPRPSPIKR